MGFLHSSSFMLGQPRPNGCLSSNIGIMLFILKFKHNCCMSLCTKRCHIFLIVATRYYAQCQQDCKSISLLIWCRWTFTNGSKTKLAQKWNDSEDERKSMYRNFYNELWTLPIVGRKNAKNKTSCQVHELQFHTLCQMKPINNKSMHTKCLLLLRMWHFCTHSKGPCANPWTQVWLVVWYVCQAIEYSGTNMYVIC